MSFIALNYFWIGIALVIFIVLVLFKIRAPYGRHSSQKWGAVMDNKWGWVLMELPALLTMPIIALYGNSQKTDLTYLLIGLWIFHYTYRTLIFPFKLKTNNKKMPLVIVFSAVFFNAVNGMLNGYFLGYLNTASIDLFGPGIYIGLALFIYGMVLNHKSDNKLISLRKRDTGYHIPQGGLFNKISCPNHFGEIIEWTGFAVIAFNISALTFAIWTACNLIPRALNHHAWYKESFEEYPKNRRAVIPYIL
ncbi:MAG: DUF1295 domain-containing protein [Crocinitomicaceae bacterium]|nr:DUF1295 domain-containing protein [Crocinitomicaceae bacterium]